MQKQQYKTIGNLTHKDPACVIGTHIGSNVFYYSRHILYKIIDVPKYWYKFLTKTSTQFERAQKYSSYKTLRGILCFNSSFAF